MLLIFVQFIHIIKLLIYRARFAAHPLHPDHYLAYNKPYIAPYICVAHAFVLLLLIHAARFAAHPLHLDPLPRLQQTLHSGPEC